MKIKLKNILIVLVILLGLILNSRVLADPSDEYEEIKKQIEALSLDRCNKLSGQVRIDCINELISELNRLNAELEKFAQKIGEKTEELQKDIQSLNNQIGYLNAQIEKTEIEVEIKEREVSLLELDISKIEEEIKGKEKEIEETKMSIADAVRALYEYDSQNLVRLTLTQGTLSDFFDEIVYINNLQESIGEVLEKLKADKKILELNKEAIREREDAVSKAKEELVLGMSILHSDRQQKSRLLEITKGDEEAYQKLLADIETQKKQLLGDLSKLSRARSAEIEALVAKYGGRLSGKVFGNFTYFAQDNGGWAKYCINDLCPPVGGYMEDWGCAITSTAMVLRYYGKSVNPGTLSKDSRILIGILISFPSAGSVYGIPCINGCTPTNNIDWSVVDNYLNVQKPVILMIKTTSGGTHFVVAIGKAGQRYYVYDPLYSVSQGMAVDLNVSVENIKNIYKTGASVTRMVIFSP